MTQEKREKVNSLLKKTISIETKRKTREKGKNRGMQYFKAN